MDLNAEFDGIIGEMEWSEVVSELKEAVQTIIDLQADAPPPEAGPETSSPPLLEGSEEETRPDSLSFCFDDLDILDLFSTLDGPQRTTAHMRSSPAPQAGSEVVNLKEEDIMTLVDAWGEKEEQNKNNEEPVRPAGPSTSNSDDAQPGTSQGGNEGRCARGCCNAAPSTSYVEDAGPTLKLNILPRSHAPPPKTNKKKRRREETSEDNRLYIKKPDNSFMIFMKERRPGVPDEVKKQGMAASNKYLAGIWNSMPGEERLVYYRRADALLAAHKQMYPDWDNSDNYGKKRKRIRRRGHTSTEDAVEPPMMLPVPPVMLPVPPVMLPVTPVMPLAPPVMPVVQQLPQANALPVYLEVTDSVTGQKSFIMLQTVNTAFVMPPQGQVPVSAPVNLQSQGPAVDQSSSSSGDETGSSS